MNRKVAYSAIKRFNGITYQVSLVRQDDLIKIEAFGVDKWSIIESRDLENSQYKEWQTRLPYLFQQVIIHN